MKLICKRGLNIFQEEKGEFVCTLFWKKKKTPHFFPRLSALPQKSFTWHFCDQLRRQKLFTSISKFSTLLISHFQLAVNPSAATSPVITMTSFCNKRRGGRLGLGSDWWEAERLDQRVPRWNPSVLQAVCSCSRQPCWFALIGNCSYPNAVQLPVLFYWICLNVSVPLDWPSGFLERICIIKSE